MGAVVSNKVLKVWNAWNVRVAVLVSLLLQILLIFLAPLRKGRKKKWVSLLIWSSYLVADWVAVYTIGHISNNVFQSSDLTDNNLQVFWSPFLLLHLGGPDTITAFSLEDNELWKRHLLGLLFQVILTVYTLIQSFSSTNFLLLVPTILMFIAGTIKYAERSYALYLACLDTIKDTLLSKPNIEESDFDIKQLGEKLKTLTNKSEKESGLLVQCAYVFYKNFKGLIVDHVLSFEQREQVNELFSRFDNTSVAFKLVEKELNFMYDMLYTKASVVHSRIGYMCRFICSTSILTSFCLFVSLDKHKLDKFDVAITYTLFIGAMSLEVVALFILSFSNWIVVTFFHTKSSNSKTKKWILLNILRNKIICYILRKNETKWPETLPQYNLVKCCSSHDQRLFNKMATILELNKFQFKPITEKLSNFIFDNLKRRSNRNIESWEEMFQIISSRGKMVLKDFGKDALIDIYIEVDYDMSLIVWHIATQICYAKNEVLDQRTNTKDHRQVSKLLSDYMFYLLILQPSFMSTLIGTGHIRSKKTFEEAKRYFESLSREITPSDESETRLEGIEHGQQHIEQPQPQPQPQPQQISQTSRADSLWSDGFKLADKLIANTPTSSERWEIISQVWVEMLFYAATQIKGGSHARQMSRGGEFLTFVWLLMVHFGFSLNYRWGSNTNLSPIEHNQIEHNPIENRLTPDEERSHVISQLPRETSKHTGFAFDSSGYETIFAPQQSV